MPSPAVSRRRLLGLGGTALASVLGGCTSVPGLGSGDGGAGATCVPRSALDSHRRLGGLPLVYEPSGQRAAFWFDAGFYGRLESWLAGLPDVLGSAPVELRTYGSWIDGGSTCDSWHHAGRAFDLAGVRLADGTEVSCRYDRWRSSTGAALDRARRHYWALAAGLHQRFAYVLTYLYDDAHVNHIHVDNGRSGMDDTTFSSRSRVQVQAVQAVCRYLWDEPTELTGAWDVPTRQAAGRVLDTLGLPGSLDRATSWQAFLAASARRGRP